MAPPCTPVAHFFQDRLTVGNKGVCSNFVAYQLVYCYVQGIISMPRLLPSPTAPMLHRIPGVVNFPRVADSPTPPSPTAAVDSSPPSSPGQFARPMTAPEPDRRSRAPQHSPAAARRSWRAQRRSLDRTFAVDLVDDGDELTSPPSPGALHRQKQQHVSGSGHRQLPYVNSLPRGRQPPQQRVQSDEDDDDDDEDWC